jgi:hypothetical protein
MLFGLESACEFGEKSLNNYFFASLYFGNFLINIKRITDGHCMTGLFFRVKSAKIKGCKATCLLLNLVGHLWING